MAKKKTTHGGARKGAGRKPKYNGSDASSKTLHLSDAFWELLEETGLKSTGAQFEACLNTDVGVRRMRKALELR